FRPKWIKYDISINKWKLDSTSLAKTIIDENSILRMQENGELQGYWIYNELTGSWHPLSVEDIDNIVNSYFEFPADPQYKTPGMYALDQQTAKNQRDVLKLVLSKVKGASPKLTIDKQPPYLIHFKDYDFDLKGWNIQPFNPDNYFISDRNYNLQEDVLNLKNLIFEDGGKELIDSLAPESTNWLLKSLGDKETLQTFLECLGLSFLNFQPEQFVIFIKSKGGTGKSVLFNYIKTLFGIDNDVIQLDFEHIIKDNSFDVSELRRKSINLTSDAKATYIPTEAVSIIKALSGNDARNLPQKFQKTADFVNHANLWFNCNKVPRLSPDSYDNSIARRFIIFDWLYIHNFQWEKKENVFQKERGELVLKALYYAKLALEMQPKKYDYLSTPVHI
ncbi:MAG: hypothetical protein K2O64_03330, partial [Lactobacillus sp.]|nr:hypothetical protein [Lactobacillus sp.]